MLEEDKDIQSLGKLKSVKKEKSCKLYCCGLASYYTRGRDKRKENKTSH